VEIFKIKDHFNIILRFLSNNIFIVLLFTYEQVNSHKKTPRKIKLKMVYEVIRRFKKKTI
jgi:hypothetical protein